jgi:hypothetical protein
MIGGALQGKGQQYFLRGKKQHQVTLALLLNPATNILTFTEHMFK